MRAGRREYGSRKTGSPEQERRALRDALERTAQQVAALAGTVGGDGADILEFQLALMEDEALLDPVFAAIGGGAPSHIAWQRHLSEEISGYESSPIEYQRARASDLADLRERVLAALHGRANAGDVIPDNAIVFADDLPPSRFLEIDWSRAGGLALAQGSPTSHVAMLARARDVPMVVQLGAPASTAGEAILDGDQATLELDPSAARLAAFEERRRKNAQDAAAARTLLEKGPVDFHGEEVKLLINIQGLEDLAHANARHADGVGLMRTEFLFTDPTGLPGEETQFRVYESVLQWAGERPVTIRTVDAGGDKPVGGFTIDGEANPFLGVRGLRLCLKRPDVFKIQLRALARAATRGNLKVMFPMVTVAEEFLAARELFQEVVDSLRGNGVAAALPELGIMIEVPAAALAVDSFPAAVFSIGSNDLTQYVMACDRSNGALDELADPLNPGVLELIRRTAEHGRKEGIPVSLCGDMAGEPRYVEALLDCGLRQLSMSPPSLGRVKRAIDSIATGTVGG